MQPVKEELVEEIKGNEGGNFYNSNDSSSNELLDSKMENNSRKQIQNQNNSNEIHYNFEDPNIFKNASPLFKEIVKGELFSS